MGTMREAVASSWAILLGFGILMLGDGLQGTLLGVRASLEQFPTVVTGLIMSAYYIGFLAGSVFAPRIVERVGHVRVFAALASLASATIVVHAVFVYPLPWALFRFVSGFCFAGIYVVTESWLNDRATNENRGQLLSLYMLLMYVGVGAGQLLLNLADPQGYNLFILISVLVSVALMPLLLSAGESPNFKAAMPLALRALYRISPLGVVGTVGAGMASSAFFSMGPVYADSIGLPVREIGFFIATAMLGAIVLQWPIGRLSDIYDRRRVILAVSVATVLAAMLAGIMAGATVAWLLVMTALFGGLFSPLYALCIAHANDFLERDQIIAASGGLVLASGIGAAAGPLLVAAFMAWLGPPGFFWMLALVHLAIAVFAVYRMTRRAARPADQQGAYAPASSRASPLAVEWMQLETNQDEQGNTPPARE